MHFIFGVLLIFATASTASGAVYMSREEALKRAFPDAERVETVNLYLTDVQRREISRLSGAPPEGSVHTFYVGKKGEKITGYAAIEAATVRTLPETLLIVLEPDGEVRFVEILAFFEPEEYKPSGRWLDQFRGKPLSRDLRVGGAIQGITGATLSAQAVTRQVRRSAALVRLLQEK